MPTRYVRIHDHGSRDPNIRVGKDTARYATIRVGTECPPYARPVRISK